MSPLADRAVRLLEGAEAAQSDRRLFGIERRQGAVVGLIDHQQFAVAGLVLRVDLDAELRRTVWRRGGLPLVVPAAYRRDRLADIRNRI